MGLKQLWFPIALAVVWVVMAALAMADFASFNATTGRARPVAAGHGARAPQGKPARRLAHESLRALPQG